MRVFYDRLIDDKDRHWLFEYVYSFCVLKNPMLYSHSFKQTVCLHRVVPLMFDNTVKSRYNMHNFDLKMHFWERGTHCTRVINLSKNYRNVIIVPAAVAMLLERSNGQEQSSWASMRRRLSYDVTLTGRDAERPHTHSSIHIAHLVYIKAILITPSDHPQ